MSRRLPRVIPTAIGALAALVVGCAAPNQLSFGDQSDAAGTPILLGNDVATPSDSAAQTATGNAEAFEDRAADAAGNTTVIENVESAFGGLIAGWLDCFHDPAGCNPNPITAPGSPERARLAEAAAYYAAERIRTKPDEGRLEWSIEALSSPSGDRARVVTCEYDTRVFFDSSMAGTEFGDIIFDTTIWTRRIEWTLARDGDEWKLWSRRIDRRSPIVRFCTP